MAITLNAGVKGVDWTRHDEFRIRPEQIIVDETLNGRHYPHTDADVAERLESFELYGQLQPCKVRKVAEGKVQLVFGFLRWKAAMAFNTKNPERPMQLRCELIECNEEEALDRNVEENHAQKRASVIDDAHNQRRFRETYGWNDSRIAKRYNTDPGKVATLKKLLSLPNDIQWQVHVGQLPVEAAKLLCDLPADEQRATLTPVPVDETAPTIHTPTVMTTAAIRARVRQHNQANGGKVPRNLSEVRKFLDKISEDEDAVALKPLSELLLKFIQGYYSDRVMKEKLTAILSAEVASE